jgi:hypothetical protein
MLLRLLRDWGDIGAMADSILCIFTSFLEERTH